MDSPECVIALIPIAAAAVEQAEQGFHVVVVPPDGALIHAPVVRLGVHPVEQQA